MKKKIIIIIAVIVMLLILLFGFSKYKTESKEARTNWWEFQSIDTMKYSRDLAREKFSDLTFDQVIDQQVKNIAEIGATHVAIATPYDEEFYPFLKRWVDAARKYGLKVWFRGNWSGWERWFDYPRISREGHIKKTEEFILKHKDLFQDGDVFSACPECENGGPGDPRHNQDPEGHKKFLIDEYKITKSAFKKIGKKVASNYASMNGDVARVIMDRSTTRTLDGVVTIDHYVATPEKLIEDIESLARVSGGKIVLGEFGAPIPDIHGRLSEHQQAQWLQDALSKLIETDTLAGISYWTNTGSSTQLWRGDGTPREAAETLKSFYKAEIIRGRVIDEAGRGIGGAYLAIGDKRYFADRDGKYEFPYFENQGRATVDAPSFTRKEIAIDKEQMQQIILKKENEDIWFKIRKFFHNFLKMLNNTLGLTFAS